MNEKTLLFSHYDPEMVKSENISFKHVVRGMTGL